MTCLIRGGPTRGGLARLLRGCGRSPLLKCHLLPLLVAWDGGCGSTTKLLLGILCLRRALRHSEGEILRRIKSYRVYFINRDVQNRHLRRFHHLHTIQPPFDLRLLKIDQGDMQRFSGLLHFDCILLLLLLLLPVVVYAHIYSTGLV